MTLNKTIQQRKLIWNAISEFYLDTELQKSDYDRIAAILNASEFKFPELKDIDVYEVFPVLKENLTSINGVWSGFEKEWFIENCKATFQKRNNSLFRIRTKIYHVFFAKMTKHHWKEIERRIKKIPS